MSERPDTIELVAVGDISLGDSAQGVGDGVHTRFERLRRRSPAYPFERAAPLLGDADIVFGNLETALSHDGISRWSVSSMEMRGHPDAAARLRAAGFTVLNVANNHMMQHGERAFDETVQAIERQGIHAVGVAAPDCRSCVRRTFTCHGLTVAAIGFAFEDDKYAPGPVAYAYGPECDPVGEVAAAKAAADVVICSVHWGVEFVRHPSPDEEALGRRLIEAGADVVLGHHPHVVRRIERHGRGLIAYSLGNFVFDMLWSPWLRTGLVLRAQLDRQGVRAYETTLVWIGDDCQPAAMAGEERDRAQAAFEALSARPDWISAPGEYRRHYEALVARNRLESYRRFVRRALRRRPIYTAQTLLRTAGRKLRGGH